MDVYPFQDPKEAYDWMKSQNGTSPDTREMLKALWNLQHATFKFLDEIYLQLGIREPEQSDEE